MDDLRTCLLCFRSLRRVVRAYQSALAAGDADTTACRVCIYGFLVNMVDLMLFLSPMVWEHHYVFALPLSIWAFATRWYRHTWRLVLAKALIYVRPTFDLYLVSYDRLTGLDLLLIYTHPAARPEAV